MTNKTTETLIDSINLTVGDVLDIEEICDGYAAAGYTVTITIADSTVSVPCWLHVGWISPGAHADIDGSGLANWGNSQPGGWSVCDGDGQFSGRLSVDDRGYYAAPITLGVGDENETVHPNMVPCWAAAIAAIDSAPDDEAEEAAIEAAETIREAIAQRLRELCDSYDSPDCPEPESEDIYDYLDPVDGLEGLQVRVGDYKGCGVVTAWRDADGDYNHDISPTPDIPWFASAVEAILEDRLAHLRSREY